MIEHIIFTLVFFLAIWAAIHDFRHMRIPNFICVAIAILFIPYAFTLPLGVVFTHVASACVAFAVCVALFFAGLFGGGDAKLFSALMLWIGLQHLSDFLLVTTLVGGGLAIFAVILRKSSVLTSLKNKHSKLIGPEDGWMASLEQGKKVVPYGIAMSAGIAVILF